MKKTIDPEYLKIKCMGQDDLLKCLSYDSQNEE